MDISCPSSSWTVLSGTSVWGLGLGASSVPGWVGWSWSWSWSCGWVSVCVCVVVVVGGLLGVGPVLLTGVG